MNQRKTTEIKLNRKEEKINVLQRKIIINSSKILKLDLLKKRVVHISGQ